MSQQYSLRWNNHQPNFISMFTSLLNTQTLVDVTLAAEGKHLQAHKVVLSACSTYFQALFVDNPSRHPIVILKDVSFADLRTMVDFMYYGEVNVTEEQLPQVLDTAKLLKIKGLTEMPDSTSLTRSQGTTADFQSPGESAESQRHSASPSISPLNRRKRRRASSTGSTCLNVIQEENRNDEMGQLVDLVKAESVILSNLQQRRPKDHHDDRIDNAQQTGESQHLLEPLAMESNVGLSQGQWSMMEHTYPRYSNACVASGGLQPEPGMYNMNVINPHINEMNNYPQGIGVVGPSVGVGCVNTDNQGAQEQATPTPPKRRRTTNPQSEENFQRALEAVRFGGIGFCKAARMFGVNNRTLWLEYKKKGYPNNRPSIKSRIKREHTTPPPEHKEESLQPEQQMALICPPHPMPVGFIDSRPLDFPLQETQSLLMVRQRNQRLKFRRQNRVEPDEREMKKQTSEPLPPIAVVHTLQKHDSYPQYTPLKNKRREQAVGSLLIRAVTVTTSPSTSHDNVVTEASGQTQRASHTPAVRSGPPLSCNFCWNTVDDCGRILRRKTQYHCPECRTNLCIVPCFHEYHDVAETDTPVNASASARFYYNHTKNV